MPTPTGKHRVTAIDWELLAEEKSPTALLFLVGAYGDRPPSLSLWSPVKIPVPQAAVTAARGCACAEAPHMLWDAAEGLEALPLTMFFCLQLDYAHGCFQCPQKVEECRENSSDNCLFVFKKGKGGDSLSGEHQFIAKYPSWGQE